MIFKMRNTDKRFDIIKSMWIVGATGCALFKKYPKRLIFNKINSATIHFNREKNIISVRLIPQLITHA